MVRTSLFLPRQLRARIATAAKTAGVKKSEIARKAIDEYLAHHNPKTRKSMFPIENLDALVQTGLLGDVTLPVLQDRMRAFTGARKRAASRSRRR